MRRQARRDSNHPAIVAELRQLGCSVLELHQLGSDVPDLCVGWQGVTALVEIKPQDAQSLRTHQTQAVKRERLERQAAYLANWQGGPAFVATSTEQILDGFRTWFGARRIG